MPLNVLIVDDSAAIRKILRRVLGQAEIPLGSVQEAANGLEALEELSKKKVHLVLSDINMPQMDGLELLAHMRAHPVWKTIPVVIISMEGGQEKVLEAVQLGAAGYVRKPFTAEQIREKILPFVPGTEQA